MKPPIYQSADIPRMLVIGLAYGLLATALLQFGMGDLIISTVWLPSGLGLAALLTCGARCWPAISVGGLIANLVSGVPLAPSLVFTLGNTLQPLLILWVLGRLQASAGAPRALVPTHMRDYARLGLAVCIVLPLEAPITTSLLRLIGAIPPDQLTLGIFRIAFVNLLGILLMTPLLLTWRTLPRGWFSTGKRALETLTLFGLDFLVGQIVFLGWFSQTFGPVARPYWIMFFIFWAALRHGRHGALLLVFISISQALLSVALGVGHFGTDMQDSHLVNLQITIMTGGLTGLVLSQTIHDLMRSRDELKVAAMVFETSSEAMLVTDAAKRIVRVNPALTAITDYSPAEVIGQMPRIFSSGLNSEDFYRQLWATVGQAGSWRGEIWNHRKGGEPFIARLSINTIIDQQGAIQGWVGLFSDVTEQRKQQEIIWKQANLDELTNLPNRRRFRELLHEKLTADQDDKHLLALLLIDLDRFKIINETLGHAYGDELLQEVARRITGCVPRTDIVGRMGGDEFAIALTSQPDSASIETITQALLARLAAPYPLAYGPVYISASIGIARFPDDALTVSNLLQCADQAMDMAKHGGRNTFRYYQSIMQELANRRMRLEGDLRVALSEQQLLVHYQPIVNLTTGEIQKAEALIRWRHPALGMISPGEFIPIAEETGLIVSIGDWVFEQSAVLSARLRATCRPTFQVSVNMSPVQFRANRDGWGHWVAHLAALNLPGHAIVAEITEGLMMESRDNILNQLLTLRDNGIQVSLDDFGTGYSSLAYLKKFDIDYLKIDQSFVRNLQSDADDLALCEAMIVMAHKLGLQVIAEGVETAEQRDLLRGIDCDYGQGYLFSRPIAAEEFMGLLSVSA